MCRSVLGFMVGGFPTPAEITTQQTQAGAKEFATAKSDEVMS